MITTSGIAARPNGSNEFTVAAVPETASRDFSLPTFSLISLYGDYLDGLLREEKKLGFNNIATPENSTRPYARKSLLLRFPRTPGGVALFSRFFLAAH